MLNAIDLQFLGDLGTDLCRRAVVGGVVEGGWERRLVGQTGILALDGVGVLVGVAAVVVAPGIPMNEESKPEPIREVLQQNDELNCNSEMLITHAPLCRRAAGGRRTAAGPERCSSYRTAAVRPLERSRRLLSLCM